MEFSLYGFLVVLIIFLPNLIYLVHPPKDMPKDLKDKALIYTIFEQVGRFGTMFFLSVNIGSFGFFFSSDTIFLIWISIFSLLTLGYYLLWVRSIVKGGSIRYGFDRVVIPIPMAVLPTLAFFLTALCTLNPITIVTSILLIIGHWVISYDTSLKVVRLLNK